jgi:rhodanese-related sulfurtransferase
MKRLFSLTAILVLMLAASVLTGCQSKTSTDNPSSANISDSSVTDKSETKNSDGYRQVDAEEAKRIMDEETGYIILDVRTEQEYSEGHIPGAVLLPDYEVAERAEELLPDKEQLILVYCRSGNRSRGASAALAKLGYTNVVEFGGIRSWPYDIVT